MLYTPSWITEPDEPADADVMLIIGSIAMRQTAINADRGRMVRSVAFTTSDGSSL